MKKRVKIGQQPIKQNFTLLSSAFLTPECSGCCGDQQIAQRLGLERPKLLSHFDYKATDQVTLSR